VADNKVLRRMGGHTGTINSIAISPNGDILASGSDDETVRLWRLEDGNLIATLQHDDAVPSVAFSPDGNTIASCYYWGGEGHILLRELARHKIVGTLVVKGPKVEFPHVRQIAFSPDGSLLACVMSATIYLLARRDGKLVHRLKGPKKEGFFSSTDVDVNCIAFSPDGARIAAGSEDKMIRLWSLA
jgi:WD40 repeat protein